MSYSVLPTRTCGHTAVLPQRLTPLELDAPATAVMTDFCRECPITVPPDHPIDDALDLREVTDGLP